MKLRNFHNLSLENVRKIRDLTKRDRFSFHYWILLLIPSIIIYFSSSWMKGIFAVPMLLTAFLIPHGQVNSIALTRVKISAVVLLTSIILNSAYQSWKLRFDFDRTIIDAIGALLCLFIASKSSNLEDEEEDEEDAKEKKFQALSAGFRNCIGFRMIVSAVQIAATAGMFKYQPIVIFAGIMLESIMKNYNLFSEYSEAVRLISLLYAAIQVVPSCLNESNPQAQLSLISTLLIASLTLSMQMLLRQSSSSLKVNTDGIADAFWRTLKRYPNCVYALDKFWAFLLPIPAIFGVWALALYKGVLDPSFIGLLAVLISVVLLLQIHWDFGRVIAALSVKMILATLLIGFFVLEEPSESRSWKVLHLILMIGLASAIEQVYRTIIKRSCSGDKLQEMKSIYCHQDVRIYVDSLERVWKASSPIISVFAISWLTLGSIHDKWRLLLLAFSGTAGILLRGNAQMVWALIEAFVIVEQAAVLFLTQTALPATLRDNQFKAVWVNVAILVIAELQRLCALPSIFATENNHRSRVRDSNNSKLMKTESTSSVSSVDKHEYDNSFLWSAITKFGVAARVSSLLALMGILLFYPQLVQVSMQTCVYSLWACLFTFLFYRPDSTARLKLIFIGILALAAGAFFLYDLNLLTVHQLSDLNTIFYGFFGKFSEDGKTLLLHGTVFWFSCSALFLMQLVEEQPVIENESVETSQTTEIAETTTDNSSPKMIGAKLVGEAGTILERVFVAQWTRSCAFLAFLAASFNPSILGVFHILIGCILAWRNILSPEMYVPVILWLLGSTFFPAIVYKFAPGSVVDYVKLLVGDLDSFESTVCLTLWALILFLQPVFMRCLMQLTTEKDRANGLVSFQVLPQEESNNLTSNLFESFENSTRYYLSNWFLEFHNEIMVVVLLVGSVSRHNLYGIVYALLTVLHVLVIFFSDRKGFKLLARFSFFSQMICYVGEYFLVLIYSNDAIINLLGGMERSPKMPLYTKFFGLGGQGASLIAKSVFIGSYVLLTVRWYLTSQYYQQNRPERRFDSHWCRLCNQVSFKSKHAFSLIKQNVHLYLGWAAHAFLFITAISAYFQPTLPSILLLVFSLVFFFYGEASILAPALRKCIFYVLGIILCWTLLDSFASAFIVFGIEHEATSIFASKSVVEMFCYFGLTSIRKYLRLDDVNVIREGVFDSIGSKTSLGLSVFLILLQIRLYSSKAWPFVMARLYHSYATAAKRAQIFNRNLQASIAYQERNFEKATKQIQAQLSSMKTIDISDWKKICYVPEAEEENESKNNENNSEMPMYGSAVNVIYDGEDDGYNEHVEQEQASEVRQRRAEDADSFLKPVNLKEPMHSNESLQSSDDDKYKKELKELEGNFYLYMFVMMLRMIVKGLLSISQDYRRLQNRPSRKATLRILFHHQNTMYRVQFFLQLLLDVVNANFDYVLDVLVLDAQVFHSSGFSFLMVFGSLLVSRLQRPFTSKSLHSRMLIVCATWILFNFCKTLVWAEFFKRSKVSDSSLFNIMQDSKYARTISRSFFLRVLGIHKTGSIGMVTLRPTLILLALSYKRSLMRQLGLWDYGKEINVAHIYYESEEDLDEVGELTVVGKVEDAPSDAEDINEMTYSSAESSDIEDELIDVDQIDSESRAKESRNPLFNTWKEIVWPVSNMPWKDFYVPMFVSDFICLFVLMYYWGDFTLGPDQRGHSRNSGSTSFFSDMVNQNMIPASLVNMVILSTFILILDRALYVSKNYLGKLMLQLATILGYHIYMFFYLPQFYVNPNQSTLLGFKLWYCCKWVYWISSALQLKYSYPPLRTETFFNSDYGIISGNLHTFYRSIPFIEEVKTVIDWAVTPSALGVWPWLKYSDIFERLYAVQCARAFQGTYLGRHRWGVPFNQFSKIMQGIVFVTVSVLILWSPFLILSRSSMMTPNTIKSFKLEISLENHGPAFLTFSQQEFGALLDPESKEYERLRYEEGVNPFEVDPNYFTRVTLPAASQVPWTISDRARAEVLEHLRDTSRPVRIQVTWTITREKSQAVPILKGSMSEALSDTTRESLARILSPETDSQGVYVTKLSGILPTLIKAPLIDSSLKLDKSKGFYELVKICPDLGDNTEVTSESTDISSPQWRASIVERALLLKRFPVTADQKTCQFYLKRTGRVVDPIEIVVYSPKLPIYNFSSFNLVGLYATVVFTVAQLFRMMHADMTTRIQYDDLPNPLPLLIMCQQILMMRELGDFESEEAIYWQLIEVLRNPQLLIEMTKKH